MLFLFSFSLSLSLSPIRPSVLHQRASVADLAPFRWGFLLSFISSHHRPTLPCPALPCPALPCLSLHFVVSNIVPSYSFLLLFVVVCCCHLWFVVKKRKKKKKQKKVFPEQRSSNPANGCAALCTLQQQQPGVFNTTFFPLWSLSLFTGPPFFLFFYFQFMRCVRIQTQRDFFFSLLLKEEGQTLSSSSVRVVHTTRRGTRMRWHILSRKEEEEEEEFCTCAPYWQGTAWLVRDRRRRRRRRRRTYCHKLHFAFHVIINSKETTSRRAETRPKWLNPLPPGDSQNEDESKFDSTFKASVAFLGCCRIHGKLLRLIPAISIGLSMQKKKKKNEFLFHVFRLRDLSDVETERQVKSSPGFSFINKEQKNVDTWIVHLYHTVPVSIPICVCAFLASDSYSCLPFPATTSCANGWRMNLLPLLFHNSYSHFPILDGKVAV